MFTFIIVVGLIAITYMVITRQYRGPDLTQYDEPKDPLLITADQISPEHQNVLARLKQFHQISGVKIADQRQRMEELFSQDVDAKIVPVDVNGVPSEWVLAENADPSRRLLYIHGGAFRVGSPKSHRYITAELSKRAGVAVLAVDYRMQPEHKIMACHEDCQTAYQWILHNGPTGTAEPTELYVAGDSAGGNLTLSVIAWARDNGLRLANGAIALAPATDSTMSSPTWQQNQRTDPFLGPSLGQLMKMPKSLIHLGQRFAGGAAPNNPILSPIFNKLSGLPPILIQASVDEMLYGDAQRYANKARSQGTDVTLQLWPTLVHVFQAFGPELPEATDALDRIAKFIAEQSRASGLATSEPSDATSA